MAREKFQDQRFNASSVKIIAQANTIIAEYQAQGFTLTLRQLYYQFVARDIIPNKQTEYKRLGAILNNARLAGLIDWEAIEDRTRNLRQDPWWSSPSNAMSAISSQYQENLWRTQDAYVEVWIEKDALVGVVEPACSRLRLPYFACRGYTSQSEQWRAGHRLKRIIAARRKPIILHFGDHDPSGLDMTRDNQDRLTMFARSLGVEVRRLALNWDQIEEYEPPPNPAKDTDSRHAAYQAEYGDSSWELDALEPTVIDGLIQNAIDGIVDADRWAEAERAESLNQERLQAATDRWDEVVEFLEREEE